MRTYGNIRLERGHWLIRAVPHVSIRLKRWFRRSVSQGANEIKLQSTDEICHDLDWFMDRYPFKISEADLGYLKERGQYHNERMDAVHLLVTGKIKPAEFKLAIPLRDYQRVAVDLALRMKGFLIADELGLGKTACAIGMMTQKETLPSLVVTKAHLCSQWKEQLRLFAPELRVHTIKTMKVYDLIATGRKGQRTLFDRFPDVVIVNYDKLRGGWTPLLSETCKMVVFDEIQELRRPGSLKYNAAKLIADQMQYRIGLSATPIYNYGGEFHPVIDCLRPDALGNSGEFSREWCDQSDRVKDPKAFGAYLREQGIMIRRTRKEVGREIPEHQIIPQYIDADLDEIEKVSKNVAELAKIILQQGRAGFDKMRAAEEFDLKMRQATGIAKAPFAAEFIKLLLESEDKVVAFAWHREVYSILKDKLKDYRVVMFTGSESTKQKNDSAKAFIEEDARVMLISVRAGEGLDGLQKACRTTVHVELDWSIGVMLQNMGRVARDGQEHPVMSYSLIANAGSDPIVADVLGLKTRQLVPVLDPEAELIEKLVVRNDNVQRLARDILAKQGIPIPPPIEREKEASHHERLGG